MPRPSRPGLRASSYSTAYVAKQLGISVPTVQRWVDAGQLKAWKTPGGHRRIDAESAERLFEAHAQDLPTPFDRAADALSVMLVEDNAADRDVLTLLVNEALPGAQLVVFESGIQALVAIGQQAPDIVITDIVMPHMNGIEMLRQLATQCVVRPRLIVAVSSFTPQQLAQKGELPPGVHSISKPIDPQPFIAVLQSVV
ncbi:MAG: response regulator [Rhizobacter sp.]|nr:response regulator [Rhizobacter sp.]